MLKRAGTIQRKLVSIVLLTSAAVLLLASTTILTYEFLTFRQTALRQASTLGKIIAANSTAALAFNSPDDAAEILGALRAEEPIVAAVLYEKSGEPFTSYPNTLSPAEVPASPGAEGYRFEDGDVIGFQPVLQNGKYLGTLYLKWDMTRVYQRFWFYGAMVVVIMTVCLLVAAVALSRILRQQVSDPVFMLAKAAKAVSEHRDYSVRAIKVRDDELGLLTDTFNHMLTQIEEQTTERRESEVRLHTQLARMQLLDRITRATAERQDLQSIFQVMVRSLEDNLPLDFACVCLYNPAAGVLTVANVGVRSETLAMELALADRATINVAENGLSACVGGQLIYESDIRESTFPLFRRLAEAGLHSFVASPLMVESGVFGVLVGARYAAHSFSSADCEFIRHLSEHVALAAHQANLYGALQQAYDDLRQSQHTVMQQERLRALGQMASGIAHDINNAISPVSLYTEALLEREPDLSEKARGYLVTIQRAIEDVALTVSRMREFYRQQDAHLQLASVNLSEIVQQVLDLTRPRWRDQPQERGVFIDLKTELADDLPKVLGVEGEIRDALTNLVFNAVDAMPSGGTLTIRTRSQGIGGQSAKPVLHLEVSDTGIGMDEETRRRCLEPFYTTKGERGTGLGLAMVYGMAQRHNATIEIDSEPGEGTTMRLVFPVSSALPERQSQVPGLSAVPSLRILIVDDDPLLLHALRDTLEGDGHVIVAANGGQAGIDAFYQSLDRGMQFDVVITDLGMPYVDGRKVAAAIKTVSAEMPILLLTGWGQRLIDDGDIPQHIHQVLKKPPRLQDLRAAFLALPSPKVSPSPGMTR